MVVEMWHDKVGLNSLLFMLHDKFEIESYSEFNLLP